MNVHHKRAVKDAITHFNIAITINNIIDRKTASADNITYGKDIMKINSIAYLAKLIAGHLLETMQRLIVFTTDFFMKVSEKICFTP